MLLEELADYLSTNGIGTVGTNLFRSFMPETPNSAVCVYETGGIGPVRTLCPGPGRPAARRPRVQVVARSTSATTARQKAQDCYALLEALGGVTLGGARYEWVGAVQEPFQMGRDASERTLIGCNFDVVRSTTT